MRNRCLSLHQLTVDKLSDLMDFLVVFTISIRITSMERSENASNELLTNWMHSGGAISGGAVLSHADNKGLSAAAGTFGVHCSGHISEDATPFQA